MLNILVTGAQGFIGKNLCAKLSEFDNFRVTTLNRSDPSSELPAKVKDADVIFHLAGENRPTNVEEFKKNNSELTDLLCKEIKEEINRSGREIKLIYTSSKQAELDNPYGVSKRIGEYHLEKLHEETKVTTFIYRLPGVFGKWSRPNYNSVVATFCHNIARNLPIQIHNPDHCLNLIYIDDLINEFISLIEKKGPKFERRVINNEYEIKVKELAEKLLRYHSQRRKLHVSMVGKGLDRALYATYLSFVPREEFSYSIPSYSDDRGTFCEMLKTDNSGQISYFTSHPGVTRGEHFHHTKSEKFLVVQGTARFNFYDINSGETTELIVRSPDAMVVDTVPGCSHSITNIGEDKLIVLLWANELFDKQNPDTVAHRTIY